MYKSDAGKPEPSLRSGPATLIELHTDWRQQLDSEEYRVLRNKVSAYASISLKSSGC